MISIYPIYEKSAERGGRGHEAGRRNRLDGRPGGRYIRLSRNTIHCGITVELLAEHPTNTFASSLCTACATDRPVLPDCQIWAIFVGGHLSCERCVSRQRVSHQVSAVSRQVSHLMSEAEAIHEAF